MKNDVFLIESVEVCQFVFTESRFVLVSMWKGRLLFLYLARNFNRLFTTGLKIKLCFKTKQRLKKVKEKNEITVRVMPYLYTGWRQQEIQIISISGDHSFLVNAAVENLLNESQVYVVIDRVILCVTHYFQIRLFSLTLCLSWDRQRILHLFN